MNLTLSLLAGTVISTGAYTKVLCPNEGEGTETAGAAAVQAGEQGSALGVVAASFVHNHTAEPEEEYETPERPGLEVGDAAPELELLDEEGNAVDLANLYAEGPVVLTFYRGGWCPYCTRALSAWAKKMPELEEAGGTFVALTPQKPEHVGDTKSEYDLDYVVLSDAEGEAGRAFKVTFSLDEKTVERYKGFGIDLSKLNAEGAWTLPAPATFVIDTDGVVQWVWADWDYSQRADPDDVIAAVAKIAG